MTAGAGRRRVWGRRAVHCLLTVAVTWIVVASVGAGLEEALSLRLAVPDVSASRLVVATLILLLSLGISALLWGRLAGELAGRDVPAFPAVRIVFAASLGRYLPGKLWQLAALGVLSGRAGIDRRVGAAAGIIAQVFALSAAAAIGAPALFGRSGDTTGATLALVGALAVVLVLLSIPGIRSRGLELACRSAEATPRQALGGHGFALRYFGMYVLNWLLYCGSFVFFVQGLGFLTPDMLPLASAFAGSYLLGYAAFFAPAGIGVREGFLIAFLRPEVGVGAVGIAILTRLWMTVVELVPAGGLALWEIRRRGPGQRHDPAGDGR